MIKLLKRCCGNDRSGMIWINKGLINWKNLFFPSLLIHLFNKYSFVQGAKNTEMSKKVKVPSLMEFTF